MSEKEKKEKIRYFANGFLNEIKKIRSFFYLLYKIDFINMHNGKIFTM